MSRYWCVCNHKITESFKGICTPNSGKSRRDGMVNLKGSLLIAGPSFGISTWKVSISSTRRACISMYLYQCQSQTTFSRKYQDEHIRKFPTNAPLSTGSKRHDVSYDAHIDLELFRIQKSFRPECVRIFSPNVWKPKIEMWSSQIAHRCTFCCSHRL